jgi:hypothetical protein
MVSTHSVDSLASSSGKSLKRGFEILQIAALSALANRIETPASLRVSGTVTRRMTNVNMLTYHICSGHAEEAVKLEAVQGLGNAYELMTKLAAKSPGFYFIVCSKSKTVRGSIDTSMSGEILSRR